MQLRKKYFLVYTGEQRSLEKNVEVVICHRFAIFSAQIVRLDRVYKDDTNCTANRQPSRENTKNASFMKAVNEMKNF